ncbi:MAG: hypothetical protein ACHQ1D_00985 [Nitrososphaerales archaeon]
MAKRRRTSAFHMRRPVRRRRRGLFGDDILPLGVGILLGATLLGAASNAANN